MPTTQNPQALAYRAGRDQGKSTRRICGVPLVEHRGGTRVHRTGAADPGATGTRAYNGDDPAGPSDDSLGANQALPTDENSPLSASVTFWTLRDVEAAVRLKKSAIYARIARGEFPRPVKLSSTVSVWVEVEVRDWMRRIVATRA
jgi:prophage regulatory protein